MKKNGNGRGNIDIELSDAELDYLKKINVAQTLADLMRHPGWPMVQEIIQNIISRVEDQHLNFATSASAIPSRDAYWISGVRLGGFRLCAKILTEELAKRVDILNQPLRPPQPTDPADLDGEMENRNGNRNQ